MARKNEPCFERCLLRRHEKQPQNRAILHVGETDDSPNRLIFISSTILKSQCLRDFLKGETQSDTFLHSFMFDPDFEMQ